MSKELLQRLKNGKTFLENYPLENFSGKVQFCHDRHCFMVEIDVIKKDFVKFAIIAVTSRKSLLVQCSKYKHAFLNAFDFKFYKVV